MEYEFTESLSDYYLHNVEQAKEILKEKGLTDTEVSNFTMDVSSSLYLMDKGNRTVHKYGTNSHDSLFTDSNGIVHYYNLQNGDGCPFDGTAKDNKECGYMPIRLKDLTPEEIVALYERDYAPLPEDGVTDERALELMEEYGIKMFYQKGQWAKLNETQVRELLENLVNLANEGDVKENV